MSFADLVEQTDRAAQAALGGELVTYAPAIGSPVPVTGIFDAQYVLAKGTANAGVEAFGPAIFFRLSDLPTVPEDDEPTIAIGPAPGRLASLVGNYRVVERRPDGMGGIVLVLRLVT